MNDPFALNPNVNFLLEMNIYMPHINSPPNMVPAGSLNIPLFEDTPAGRSFEERRNRFTPPAYVPPKIEIIPYKEIPLYIPPVERPIIKLETPYKEIPPYVPLEYKLPKF